jgi:hypothetical protein
MPTYQTIFCHNPENTNQFHVSIKLKMLHTVPLAQTVAMLLNLISNTREMIIKILKLALILTGGITKGRRTYTISQAVMYLRLYIN